MAPNFSLQGRIAVVTGASRGIGGALAHALAHAGADLALLARDTQALDAAAGALEAAGRRAASIRCDVTRVDSIERAFDEVMTTYGRVDVLVNNAGTEQLCDSLDVSEALWDRIIATNLKGAFFAAQAAARRMSRGGSIVNVCSLTSEAGVAGAAPYGASKAGLAGLTRALATEWAPHGIRVNGIGPGYFRTALTEPFYGNPDWQRRTLDKIPLRRFGALEDLAGAAVFLASGAAAYITGQILYIDGGMLAAL